MLRDAMDAATCKISSIIIIKTKANIMLFYSVLLDLSKTTNSSHTNYIMMFYSVLLDLYTHLKYWIIGQIAFSWLGALVSNTSVPYISLEAKLLYNYVLYVFNSKVCWNISKSSMVKSLHTKQSYKWQNNNIT